MESNNFLDFPVDKYAIDDGMDLDADGVLDQVYTTDNAGALIIDDNGNAHVFYGIMRVLMMILLTDNHHGFQQLME